MHSLHIIAMGSFLAAFAEAVVYVVVEIIFPFAAEHPFISALIVSIFAIDTSPKTFTYVTFYDEYNLEGNSFGYNNAPNVCMNLETMDFVKSVDTHGNCIRMYDGDDCMGRSITMYPGHNDLWNSNYAKKARSFSKCLQGNCFENNWRRKKRSLTQKPSSSIRFAADLLYFGLIYGLPITNLGRAQYSKTSIL